MALDLHQKQCPNCNDYIPFTRKYLIFRPLPKRLVCPTCGHPSETTFFQRGIAFFFWTMRTYMFLGIVFFLVVTYVRAGHWDTHGPSRLIGHCLVEGPTVFFMLSFICLVSSFCIQACVDYVFKFGDKRE